MQILTGVHTHIGQYHILHGVDFVVPQGQTTMLLGRNGAGKTTTLRTVMGLSSPSSGQVVLAGRNIEKRSTPDIAGLGVGYVPETMAVFSDLTVKENLVLAAREGPLDDARLQWIFGIISRLEAVLAVAGRLAFGWTKADAVHRSRHCRTAQIAFD